MHHGTLATQTHHLEMPNSDYVHYNAQNMLMEQQPELWPERHLLQKKVRCGPTLIKNKCTIVLLAKILLVLSVLIHIYVGFGIVNYLSHSPLLQLEII
jgi:hypothetical protein